MMRAKKSLVSMLLMLMLVFLAACGGGDKQVSGEKKTDANKKPVNIGITQIIEHPALDATREGFIQALKENGYADANIDYQSAQGDQSTVASIAQKFAADKKDAILAISTPSAQSMIKATKGTDIPVFFGAITDPISAKLVDNKDKPGHNVTGASDTHPEAIGKMFELIKGLYPNTKTVGVIYNSGEANSVVNVKKAKESMNGMGMKTIEANASNTSEVKQAVDSLVGKVDVIYVPKDNTAVAAIKTIVQVSEKNKIPLFVGETDSVRAGGFAGFGIDYKDHGYQLGLMAIKVLKGEAKPGDMPVEYPKELKLVVNKEAAANEGIDLAKFKPILDKYNATYVEKTEKK
ncbi:ABC transporter substrate-binding protein [Aneurinibacillus uraniidurans]|uniref:ABC transporter substrate-binding protein n=1 Tax=Aneurinibacillus uraniidurans TaxID=2966586 RepID=UPI00234A0599|nr:ABC transporter substrate-binding protein [Aneurinibacillus sp. B1]WCN38264.1 ABC transporter substrate-binding protein [Aneurinibacillus sp. B1]